MRLSNANGFLGELWSAINDGAMGGSYDVPERPQQITVVEKKEESNPVSMEGIEQLVSAISESTRKAAEIGATDDNRVLIVNNFNFIFCKK
jgi:hypothetical protein